MAEICTLPISLGFIRISATCLGSVAVKDKYAYVPNGQSTYIIDEPPFPSL